MTRSRHLWAIAAITAIVLGGTGRAFGQNVGQNPDPWQYPKLIHNEVFERWWWAFEQRAYPLGDIPAHAHERAVREIATFTATALLQPALPVSGDSWVNIGPAPTQNGQIGATQSTRAVSGRVQAVAVDPTNNRHWLIGAAQGGVWETTDAGANWAAKTDAQASLATGAISFAPNSPNVIYAGTGEAAFSGDAYAGAGLLKSTDGGATWQLLASATFAKTAFSDISVAPTDPASVLAATARGVAGRGADSPPSSPPTGIFKSTDGGVSWSLRLSGAATDLEVDPANFARAYAGIGEVFGGGTNGVYRSTDTGSTWTLVTGPWSSLAAGVGRIELAIAPSDSNVAYVSIQDAFNGSGHDGGLLGLWKTSNAWAATPTWTAIPTGATDDGSGVHGYCGWDKAFSSPADQCWYSHDIIVDPTNPGILYAGGIPLWKYDGINWMEVSMTVSNPNGGIHVDQQAMAWAGTRLIVGNDGGVWSTNNGGSTWSDHNTNLATIQFYDGSVHPSNPNFALGGSQDNGTEKWTGSDGWPWIFGGDGADNAIASSHPDTNWALSFQNLGIVRTTDGGASFVSGDSGIDKTGAPFIARFERCPANDNVFIAGTDNLWRSNNFFSGPSPSWSSNGPEMAASLTGLAFAPADNTCSTYAFGTQNGSLRLTTTSGATWADIDAANAVPNRFVTDLVFDPTNSNVLYVTLSGFDEGTPGQPGHVFKTTNALAGSPGWSNVSPPVNIPANTITLDPFDPAIVYVGTDMGVWKSTNGGGVWTFFGPGSGMPNVAVFELQISAATNRLVAFTHGRSAFALSQSAATPTPTETNTPVPPTRTNTRVLATVTPTNTPVPATATRTNTPIAVTATPTNPRVSPSATPTLTSTPAVDVLPDCTNAVANPATLWPAHHKYVKISVGGMTNPDGSQPAITITSITQDEPLDSWGDGHTCPDGAGVGTDTALVRAERATSRRNSRDGRVYHINFIADDGLGGQCAGTVTVCVPRTRHGGAVCVDEGPLVDSTGPCD